MRVTSNKKILFDPDQCDFCGICAACCKTNAITVKESDWGRDETLCDSCLVCVKICPMRALSVKK